MRDAPVAAPLPSWPALMDESMACAYTSLRPESFRAVMALQKIKPVDMGLRLVRWRRADLDRAIDRLPLRDSDPQPDPDGVEPFDAQAEALKRVQARRRRA